jgi:hypothetical protein
LRVCLSLLPFQNLKPGFFVIPVQAGRMISGKHIPGHRFQLDIGDSVLPMTGESDRTLIARQPSGTESVGKKFD